MLRRRLSGGEDRRLGNIPRVRPLFSGSLPVGSNMF